MLIKTTLKSVAYGILWLSLFSIEVHEKKVFDHLSSWVENQTWLDQARQWAFAQWSEQDKSTTREAEIF